MARDHSLDIAITGIAARLPGGADVEPFWNAVLDGRPLIRHFERSELEGLGLISETLLNDPRFVPACGYLENSLRFDNDFFRISARDAELTDPQYRIMLEVSWLALEDAGSARADKRPLTGVFASGSSSGYMRALLVAGALDEDTLDAAIHGCEPDFIATTVAYRLGLTGQAASVQTACSSSLVAVHMARQALLNQDIDQALVVASGVPYPQGGYLHLEGGIRSGTGRCLPFDRNADGVVPGGGTVAVVMRRRQDAVKEQIPIHGFVIGSAINNDGVRKAGYMAPSVDGQAEVITRALAASGVGAESICYLETHGTATAIGDPLEWSAASLAYTRHGARPGQIALGATKANIGHLDGASGLAGLIKVLLMMKHHKIPPLAGFSELNGLLEAEGAPFRVPTRAENLPASGIHRAGISSFGVGGTNCHLIVESVPAEAPAQKDADSSISRLVVLSAKNEATLDRAIQQLAAWLQANPDLQLTDVARTLGCYREAYSYRKAIWARSTSELLEALTGERSTVTGQANSNSKSPIVFAFPGQGSQYPGMGKPWREGLPGFQRHVQNILSGFSPATAAQVEQALYNPRFSVDQLNRTELAQPALFALCGAASAALEEVGIQPDAVIGHSFGELVALVAANVISPEDGARLAEIRGQLMQASPPGAMIAVGCSSRQLFELNEVDLHDVSVTAYNSPRSITLGGPPDSIRRLAVNLDAAAIPYVPLPATCAFHTASMTGPARALDALLPEIVLSPASIPLARNLDGMIIPRGHKPDPADISKHALEPVHFDTGVRSLLAAFPSATALEIGPGHTIAPLCQANGMRANFLSGRPGSPDSATIKNGLAKLWVSGQAPDLPDRICTHGKFIRLPGYSFSGREFIHPVLAQTRSFPPPSSVSIPEKADQLNQHTSDLALTLSRTWQKYLRVQNVTSDANFFDLGGDSLAVVSMAANLRQSLRILIDARELLATPVFGDQVILLKSRS